MARKYILLIVTVLGCAFVAGCKSNIDANNPPVKKGEWGKPPAGLTGGNTNPGMLHGAPPTVGQKK